MADQDFTTNPPKGKFVAPYDKTTSDHAGTPAQGLHRLDELALNVLSHRARWPLPSLDVVSKALRLLSLARGLQAEMRDRAALPTALAA